MTKEEIRLAAIDCLNESMVWKPYSSYEDAILTGFYDGVDWAQKQMQESNEGQALLYAVEKTAERIKREMIEKAVEWLKEEMHYKDHSSGRGSWGEIKALGVYDSLEEFIEDFKQAMRDERK